MSAENVMSKDSAEKITGKKVKLRRKLLDDEYEVLISEVQSRPALWNDYHNDFKNSLVTRKQWNQVGAAINLSGEEAKTKWKNVKDKFRKILRKPPPKSGSAACTPKPNWKFYDRMQFTKDVVLPSHMIGNLTPAVAEEDTSNSGGMKIYRRRRHEDLQEEGDIFNDEDSLLPQTEQESQQKQTASSTSGIGINRRFARPHRAKTAAVRNQQLKNKLMKLVEKKIDVILSTQKKKYHGEDYYFFMSLLPFVKDLAPLAKLQLRSTIQTLIMEAYRLQEAENVQELYFRPSSEYTTSASSTPNY